MLLAKLSSGGPMLLAGDKMTGVIDLLKLRASEGKD
jgi:hypothetical protein